MTEENLLNFACTDSSIGLSVRNASNGPESELVRHAVGPLVGSLHDPRYRIAVFQEPRVYGGCPDLVIALYDPAPYRLWNEYRSQLAVRDIKVLQHIEMVGPLTSTAVGHQLGLDQRSTARAVESLCQCGLLRLSGGTWHPIPLEKAFGIVRLVALEAKMTDRKSVLFQASRNRGFASESYVLLPNRSPSLKVQVRAKALGIGVFTYCQAILRQILPSNRYGLPASYASWLFNEWIGRALHAGYPKGAVNGSS